MSKDDKCAKEIRLTASLIGRLHKIWQARDILPQITKRIYKILVMSVLLKWIQMLENEDTRRTKPNKYWKETALEKLSVIRSDQVKK